MKLGQCYCSCCAVLDGFVGQCKDLGEKREEKDDGADLWCHRGGYSLRCLILEWMAKW